MGILDSLNNHKKVQEESVAKNEADKKKQEEDKRIFQAKYETTTNDVIKPFIIAKIKELNDGGYDATSEQLVFNRIRNSGSPMTSFSLKGIKNRAYQFDISDTANQVCVTAFWTSMPIDKRDSPARKTKLIKLEEVSATTLEAAIETLLNEFLN